MIPCDLKGCRPESLAKCVIPGGVVSTDFFQIQFGQTDPSGFTPCASRQECVINLLLLLFYFILFYLFFIFYLFIFYFIIIIIIIILLLPYA